MQKRWTLSKDEMKASLQTVKNDMRRAFYEVVERVPEGLVVTYGQVATLAGYPGLARQVGYALAALPEKLDLPWHRVINAQGKVSPRKGTKFHLMQYEMLEAEGVAFTGERIDLQRYRWAPEGEEE
ncbi:MAG: methylated-DNA-protein-cysteine methyltransferase-like protein [Candidatus Latescibacterota bacterium]|jgi:methylated-DNA-protein-cysteine methyltransferase-like protein